MNLAKTSLLLLLVFICTIPALSQDRKGCRDSPLITRFPGSTISDCKDAEFDQFDFPVARDKTKHMEGQFHSLVYNTKSGLTDIQVYRNIQNALKASGFTVDYEVSPYSFTAHHDKTWFHFNLHDTGGGSSATVFQYDQTIVSEAGMSQEVTANAAALSSDLTASGHTVVHGIYFDTGKADLKPESDASLKEVAKMLQQNPSLKVYVVGHTDNVGALAANVALSDQRAASVRKALITQYKIPPERLVAHGDGPYSPVATNDTDDGRALNRRVELVKQ